MIDTIKKLIGLTDQRTKIVEKLLDKGSITVKEAAVLLERAVLIEVDVSSGAVLAGGNVEQVELEREF